MERCPKCHQPVADADAGKYLCCAAARLQWQCEQCGEVSEGFAFAYRRCPRCGGELAPRGAAGSAAVADAAALDAVRTAFEIELGGRAFYQRAAAEAADETLRALFGRFAVMEGAHMETLARRYHVDLPDPPPGFRIETAAVHAQLEARPGDPSQLFRIAIALEERAAVFFAERAARAAIGSAERQLYDELATEEREHAQALVTEWSRWRGDAPGAVVADPLVHAARSRRTTPAQLINGAELLLAGHDAARVALVCGGEQITYGQLRDRVARAAAVWREHGLRPGDRVAVKLPDGFDWVVAFLGAIWAGGVAVGVNPRIPAPEWQYILDEAGFNVIVAEDAADTPAPWCDRVIRVDEGRRAVAAAAPIEAVHVDEDTPALWVHSSGTSGKPKAVVHAHRCMREIAQISAERLGIGPDDRLFASSRLFFAYPLTNLLLAGLRLGTAVLLDPQWPTAASFAASAAALKPTVLFSVPSLYRNLLHEGLAEGLAASGVRLCVSAGEALSDTLRNTWQQRAGLPIVDGYGASETLVLVLTALPGDDALCVSPGVKVRPLDPDAAHAGGPTRLLIDVPTLALGYLDRPAAQAESFRDGVFCPADLFVRSGEGWRFAGREDSLVKIRGRWVNLIELEERLAAGVPGLRESAAVCVPDADGVDAVAFFFAAADPSAVQSALDARIAGLPHYQRPAWLRPIDTLPRTATGKLLRRKLVERLKASA
jgi:acyl-coenzyme A synthetase/AMP-(fatty) acid ligase/rubrerythrin